MYASATSCMVIAQAMLIGVLLGLILSVSPSNAQEIPRQSRNAADWILPKVCVDSTNRAASVDPYPHCPPGTTLRTVIVGDQLPYRKMDQTKTQYKDLYPRIAADGAPIIVAPFDTLNSEGTSVSSFRTWADGYDVYTIRDGWVSVSETRIGTGEFGTSFMGAGCKNRNGLILLPASFPNVSSFNGRAMLPVAAVAWEINNEVWPGACPTQYVTDQITTWTLLRNLSFGGISNVPPRELDAIVTTVGMRASHHPKVMRTWQAYGHLEVFYFTNLYGLSRWERWAPEFQFDSDGREAAAVTQQRAAGVTTRCKPLTGQTPAPFTREGVTTPSVKVSMIHEGQSFIMTDCRDWTNIVVEPKPTNPPVWPVSALNLLSNFHFNGASVDALTNWNTASLIHGQSRISKTKEDTTKNSLSPRAGVAYLRIDCSEGCHSERLFQEVPVTQTIKPRYGYSLGVIARTESTTGELELSLSQLDDSGAILTTNYYIARLSSEQSACDWGGGNCRQFSYNPRNNSGSVILSSDFVQHTFPIQLSDHTKALRFTIAPKSASVFNLVSAWLMDAL